ncbi:Adhesin/invasin protein PagN [Yersinia frederiksenii]|nr:outer membrane beta-barrel protein [Yersinia frederiksenii]CQH57330.1 Adhesin/invasin protein PagN [Yersinia frederiksenii]
MMRNCTIAIAAGLLIASSAPALADQIDQEGYYGSIKLLRTFQEAKNMDTSSRPGIGSFVSGQDSDNFYNGAIAAGYQFGNGWRTEGEYTLKNKSTYTSGSTNFPTSFNHQNINSERLMLNAYRDIALSYGFALYGTLGIGVARISSDGWQGNPARQYASSTQNNLTYAIGAGVSYSPIESLILDLGYRYVDMGNVQSGFNQFANARSLQDEQMKAHLVSSEFLFGARYLF